LISRAQKVDISSFAQTIRAKKGEWVSVSERDVGPEGTRRGGEV